MPHPLYNLKYLLQYVKSNNDYSLWPNHSEPLMYAIAEKIPPLSGFGLEQHLGHASPRTDFLVRITKRANEISLSNNESDFDKIHKSYFYDQSWSSVLNFISQWNNAETIINKMVDNVWLEFDIDPLSANSTIPSFFFDIDRNTNYTTTIYSSFINKVFNDFNKPLSPSNQQLVNRILQIQNLKVYYIGLMWSRVTGGLRLCLKNINAENIAMFLQKLEWPGNINEVQYVVRNQASLASEIVLNVDVNEVIGSKIGFELYFEDNVSKTNFISNITSTGICSEEESAQLISFPSETEITDAGLRQYLSSYAQKNIRYLGKRLNHVKLNYLSNSTFEAKAYQYFCYY